MALCTVTGRLLFFHQSQGKDKPMHHMKLELLDRDLFDDDLLASGLSAMDGRFELTFDPAKAGHFDSPDLCLRIMAPSAYGYDNQANPSCEYSVIANFNSDNHLVKGTFDIGDLHIAYWEYENPEEVGKIAFTPRVAIVNGEVPQSPKRGTKTDSVLAYTRHLLTYQKHKLINKFDAKSPSNQTIEAAYPANLTRTMEAQAPGSSRSDDYLVDLVLNGFNPCRFKRSDTGEPFIHFDWSGYEQDGHHFAPNTAAFFRLEDEKLILDRIYVTKRINGDPSAHALYREPKVYRPSDGPVWDRVKRLFRVNLFLFGEADTHLGETHLNVEQYIVPIVRNLRLNPVARLLDPHFYGTVSINKGANSLLIDKDGLVGFTSALTPGSVSQFVRNAFSGYNWYGWAPRQPICESHRFAKLSQLFWGVVQEYVASFFQENDTAIRANWAEVLEMSNELVSHSVPYLAQGDRFWWDTHEVNTNDKPRPLINGVEVALSAITHSDSADDEGLANLRQMCAYLIFHSTFKHSWVNDRQYDIGGEIDFATLGVSDDITNMDIDASTAVDPVNALEHPFITLFLTSVKYGYIMRNEDKDMHPKLRELLGKQQQAFADLGLSISDIRSRIDI